MKIKLVLIFCMFSLLSLNAQNKQMRERVGVIRPSYHETTVAFLVDFSKTLRKDGFVKAADYLEAYAKGGFGSGFVVYVKETNKTYMLTNKHVVEQAKSVNVEFINADQSTVNFKNCPVVAMHEDIDLAAVLLPKAAKKDCAFVITNKTVKDGFEVFSAGFPGLSGDPSWQLGKGIISNNSFHSDELTGDKKIPILQHTAQIDPGSSGGPLLLKGDNGEYEIVGINSWKVTGRENVNFAIPSSAVDEFIKEYLVKETKVTLADLKPTLDKFVNASKINYKDVLPFISYRFLQEMSSDAFYNILDNSSEEVYDDVVKEFKAGKPIQGVRIAMAGVVADKLSKKIVAYGFIPTSISLNNIVPVKLNYGNKELDSKWVLEQNKWKLASLSSVNFKRYTKKGIDDGFFYKYSIKAGSNICFGDDLKGNYAFTFSTMYSTYYLLDFNLNNYSFNANIGDDQKNKMNEEKVKEIGIDTRLQLPIGIADSFYVMPYIKYGAALIYSLDNGGVLHGFGLGTEFTYKIKRKFNIIGNIGYRKMTILNDGSSDYSNQSKLAPNALSFGLGFTF